MCSIFHLSRTGGPLLLAALWIGCGKSPAAQPVKFEPKRVAAEHLPNPWQVHPQVISGGLPEGEAAFAELEQLGIKTVISVDGAKPDVELAKKHHLRYVHLPHGYDGIPPERVQDLAKAVRDLPGPIYIHCHHGKHRSPAAAAVACVAAGLLEPGGAVAVLQAAGTSENYRGLYESAREARPLDAALLAQLKADFPETATLPPLAEAMIPVEHTHDHLKQIEAAGWKSPPQSPDLDPAHEALLLREHFTELLRMEAVQAKPEAFRRYLQEGEQAAQGLETALRGKETAEKLAPRFAKITQNCTDCHKQFRDVPLSEKRKQL